MEKVIMIHALKPIYFIIRNEEQLWPVMQMIADTYGNPTITVRQITGKDDKEMIQKQMRTL